MKKYFIFLIVLFFPYFVRADYIIPRLDFYGDIANMTEKSDERKILVHFESADKEFDSYAKLKIQGRSSLRFEKKKL